ncbi:hypothetical protein OIO90_000807 [Microbotryomycetes sp. JL221]|nr:hypothetical protein OIO90_000807 [Microbotryomycetes sp. JL221]
MGQLKPALIVCMGVSGSGKSSIGLAIAQALKCPFVDGDDLHPASNVAKMSSGTPLNDEDRIPWLHSIRQTAFLLTSDEGVAALSSPNAPQDPSVPQPSHELASVLNKVHPLSLTHSNEMNKQQRRSVVIGCSALKQSYRDLLRGQQSRYVIDNVERVDPASDNQDLDTYFVYLHGTRPLLLHRMEMRPGHFFKAPMLDSQLSTLERPDPATEPGVAVIQLGQGPDEEQEVGMEGVAKAAVEAANMLLGLSSS